MKQQKNKRAIAAGIWYVAEPMVLYWLVTSVALACFSLLMKPGTEYSVGMSALAISIGGVFAIWYFRKEIRNSVKREQGPTVVQWILLLVTALALSLWMNIVVVGTGLAKWSASYQQVEQQQYAISLVGGVLFYGLLSPFVEELIFRGLTQTRLRKVIGVNSAIVVSAVFFGAYHGNWIQGIYAFVMGVFFATMYQQFKNLLVPVVLHSIVNVVIFATSYTGIMQEKLVQKQYFWISFCVSIIGIVGMIGMIKKGRLK